MRLKKIREMSDAEYWALDDRMFRLKKKVTYYPLPSKRQGCVHCRVTDIIDDCLLSFSAITMTDLHYAKQKVPASNSPAEVKKYEQFYRALQKNLDPLKMPGLTKPPSRQ